MRKVSQGKEVHADIRKRRDTGSYRNLPSRNVRVLSTHGDTVHAGMKQSGNNALPLTTSKEGS